MYIYLLSIKYLTYLMFVQPDVTVIYLLVEMLLNEVIKIQNITHAFYTCFFLNNIDEPIQNTISN
jgi:hypothetical protein